MLKVTLSRLLAVALNMHLTLHLLLFEQSMLVLIAIGMQYLVLMKREIYSIEVEGNKLLHLCFVFKIIVCKDDVFLAFTATNYE